MAFQVRHLRDFLRVFVSEIGRGSELGQTGVKGIIKYVQARNPNVPFFDVRFHWI